MVVAGTGAGAVTVVWRVVVVLVSGSLEHETSVRARTENTEVRMIDFFIVNCFFKNSSSQVASTDVLKRRILSNFNLGALSL